MLTSDTTLEFTVYLEKQMWKQGDEEKTKNRRPKAMWSMLRLLITFWGVFSDAMNCTYPSSSG